LVRLSRTLRCTGLALLVFVLASGPFFRGLFFWTESLAATALLSLGFGLWLIGRRLDGMPVRLTGGTPGVALLALLACYLVQFVWAVYPRGNLDWVLRVTVAWLLYVMVRAEAGPALRRWLAWALVLSASGMAFMGFLEFTGYFAKDPEMMQALGLVNLADRMATPIQYPNTAAAYFMAAVFAAAGLALEDLKRWKLMAATGLITLISTAFFFTVSRGAVLVLPFGLLLFFLGLDREKRWPGLLLLVTAWIPMFAILKSVGSAAAAQQWQVALVWVGTATAAGAVAGLMLSYFLRLKLRAQLALAAGGLVLVSAAAVALRPAGGLLPKQAARLLDMNFRTANVIYRLTLFDDAGKMIADRPLGRGGWGWERNYRQYQEYYYVGRETHSHYLQTAVEAGVPGALALVGAMAAAMWAAWANRKGNTLAWSLAAGAGLIAGHSIIEFNLSYGLVWFGFWSMLAVAAAPLAASEWKQPVAWSAAALSVGVAGLAAILTVGAWYADKANRLVEAQEPDAALAPARTAAKLDPWNSAPLLVLGDIPALQRATRVDPYLTNPHWELAVKLQNQEDWDGARREARLTLERHPLVSLHYTKLASVIGRLLNSALHNGDVELARQLGGELADLGADLIQRKELAARAKGPWMGRPLTMEPEFKLRYGQALFLKGQVKEAVPYLTDAAKVGLLGAEAHIWLYVIYEQQGDKKALAALESKPWIRFRNANPIYKLLTNWKA